MVASGDDTSHSQSDPYATFTLTNARVTLACAICISDITFKQLDDPSSGEEAKSVVPDTGTYDGNVVEISATVHNAADRSLTVPFSFIDKTTGKPLNEADGDRLVEPQTIGAGATTTITFDWDTRGTAWRHMQPMPTHTIQVLTGFGGAQRDITVLPKPVVLVHGWNSDASTWETMKSLLTAKDEHWPVFAVGDSWSQAGMTMDTDPVSGNSIEANARAEARYIEHVRSLTKAQHVDLVVHSMGGLISRDYIDHMMMGEPHPPGGRPLVSHLVMLGTPNQGSACAYAAGGAAVYFGKAVPTIQLTPVYVADIFDKYVRNQHGVPFSVDAGTGYPVCFTGDGDGVVTRDSAWWIYSDVGERPGDLHTDLPSDPAIADQWVMDHVAKAWFEESTPSGRRPSPAPEPPPAVQQVAIGMPAVARGHDVIVKVPVTTAKRLEVILVGPASVAATLLRPTGAVSVSQKAGSTAARRPFRSLQVAKPTAGMWKLRLHQTAAASANVMLSASLQGATKTEGVSVSRLSGRRLKVTAKLRKGTHPITGATAQALLRRTGGRLITIGLVDNGTHGDARAHDGIYTATTAALPVGDYYVVGKAVKATMRRYVASAISIR
ncbi:esterase/lipase family protein [Nocardioides terrisoli]|uniref:esterase/lipase family protein n=1 Tax=Nocardioides terrisoli TaxID=3388267 RepID=UPI00287BB5D3|nr:choice-of-anchor X domain-containing protein [Nocardioides marmorisolisilvae]